MKIATFCQKIAEKEGLKKQVDIAQISEIVRIAKALLMEGGVNIYIVMKNMKG